MNKEKFDITCTATLRPELLDITLSSFTKYLFKERISCARLIINIDMVGAKTARDENQRFNDIMDIIGVYPFYETIINIGEGNFPKAWYWCMSQLKHDFFFHLEEDWEILYPIDFNLMWDMFRRYHNLAHLRLSSFVSEDYTCKNWNKFLFWNEEFYEVPDRIKGTIGWAGHPSLNSSSFMRECLPYINSSMNPEKQIKGKIHPNITQAINEHRFGSFHPQNSPPSIIDRGRKWMIENGYKKSGNKAWFVKWERSNQ